MALLQIAAQMTPFNSEIYKSLKCCQILLRRERQICQTVPTSISMRLSLARDSAPSSQDAASCSSGVFRVASSSVAFSFAACQPNEWAVSHIGFGISALIVCPSYKPRGQTLESGPFLRHGVQRTGHMILVEVCTAV